MPANLPSIIKIRLSYSKTLKVAKTLHADKVGTTNHPEVRYCVNLLCNGAICFTINGEFNEIYDQNCNKIIFVVGYLILQYFSNNHNLVSVSRARCICQGFVSLPKMI